MKVNLLKKYFKSTVYKSIIFLFGTRIAGGSLRQWSKYDWPSIVDLQVIFQ